MMALRWATLEGNLLSTPQEMAEAEAHRAEMEKQRAQAEAHRAEMEKQRAEIEARRAAEAEAEVAWLRALLTRQGDASTKQ